ncbi:MAG: hypothetical protein ACFFDY_00325 [Candidatus Thorarchaeota archaeon]
MNREDRPKKPRQIKMKIYPELFSLGRDEAMMISDFIDTWVDKYRKGLLDKDGFFEYSRLEVSNRLNLGKDFQHNVLKILEYLGIIEVKILKKSKGKSSISTKRLIRLNQETFSTSPQLGFSTSSSQTSKNEDNYRDLKEKLDEAKNQTCIIYNILLYYILSFSNTYVLEYNTNVLSSNSRVLEKVCPDKSGQEIISFFNSLENLRTHNRVRGGRLSKTYIRCEKKIKLLKDGLFYSRYRLNKNFLDKHQIPNLIYKKFTDREIMRGFRNLSILVENEYGYVTGKKIWPNVGIKEKIKKLSIEDLLFHPVNKNSWFLIALYHKPKLIYEQLRVPFEEKYLNIFSSVLSPDVDLNIKQRLVYTIDSIIKAQDYLIDTNKFNWNGMSLGYKGDPENFLKKYFWFIKDELGIDGERNKLSFLRNSIRSKSFWNSFCDFLREEFFLENTEGAKKMFK